MEKNCWRCKRTLPEESFEFRADKSKGRQAACRECQDPDGVKRCRKCERILPKSEFHRASKGKGSKQYYQSDCKRCQRGNTRTYRLSLYHLTDEDYERMLRKQGYKCAICGGLPLYGHHFHVDHDHTCCDYEGSCGACVRGLLCDDCNRGLGMFRDRSDALRNAASYVERYARL